MKASYISYFEGYDATGGLILGGNGSYMLEYDEVEGVEPAGLLEDHVNHVLGVAREKDANVVSVIIKNISRL